MQESTVVTLKCPKCGKMVRASTEEEARKKLISHDEEMHEATHLAECEKGRR